MEKQMSDKSTQPEDVKLVHVKIIGGTQADIYEIGKALKEFKSKLPFRLEAIVTNDRVQLKNIDDLIRELYKLKKLIDREKKLAESGKSEMSNLQK